jgi:hypothetical protein
MQRLASVGLAALALAGCSSEPDKAPLVAEGAEQIPCALGGAAAFSSSCAVDRSQVDGKLTLIVRHPDGAFRRFAVVTDGRGLTVADGAEQAVNAVQGDKLAVTVAGDRYLFPAKVKAAQGDAR